jgi:broad specificity phosphatase PhoE
VSAATPSAPPPPLLLVRHGRTAANASGLLLGRHDPPLDDRGLDEAAALGRELRSGRFGELGTVVCSPLLRTRQTAEAIGLPVVVDERLIELDYGSFEGLPLAEVSADTWRQWRDDADFAPPGGESHAALGRRVRAACEEWTRAIGEAPDASVVLVSHVSPIKAAIAWALGVGDEIAWRMHLDTASISRVVHRGPVPALQLCNDTAHLPRP